MCFLQPQTQLEKQIASLGTREGRKEVYCRKTTVSTKSKRRSVSQFITALKQCSKSRDLELGRTLHFDAVSADVHTNKYVASVLITMYRRCGNMSLAREVFDGIKHRDVALWNSIILGYVDNDESPLAMELFENMDCTPDSFTYVAALKACSVLASEKQSEKRVYLEKGAAIHQKLEAGGLDSEMIVATSLMDMYTKCGSMHRARDVFERMPSKDVVTWTSLLLGYVENGESLLAMELFTRMNCPPDPPTYVAFLKACSALASENDSRKKVTLPLQKGVELHEEIKARGFDSDIVVATTLVDMYSKCGSMDRARDVFERMPHRNVVTWTALLLGYVENGQSSVAMDMFSRMNCEPNAVTYVVVLKACRVLAERDSEKQFCLERGIALHKQIRERGFESETVVATTLVDMYMKCGCMQRAREVFDKMDTRTAAVWSSLLLGYVENGDGSKAMEVFVSMDCEPSSVTYVAALKACSCLNSLPLGRDVHARICRAGLEQERIVRNGLTDFYGKSGCMSRAEECFSCMHPPDVVSWNSLITGYGSLGDSSRVLGLMSKMHEAGVEMDAITFTAVLTACSHAGLVGETKAYLDKMVSRGLKPAVEHYNCLVDALGRVNKLQEALALVRTMPVEANDVTWRTLLVACKKSKNLEVGEAAFEELVATGSRIPAAYVMMRDIYRD